MWRSNTTQQEKIVDSIIARPSWRLPPSPLELIADWMVARYPRDFLATQLGVSSEVMASWLDRIEARRAIPPPRQKYEPSPPNAYAMMAYVGGLDAYNAAKEEQRQACQAAALAAAASAKGKGEDAEHRAAAHALKRKRKKLRASRGSSTIVTTLAAGRESYLPRGRLEPRRKAFTFGNGGNNGGWDESKRLAGQKVRSEKAAERHAEIIRLRDQGKKQADIALLIGCNVLTVWRTLKAQSLAAS